ncbi:peptidylprolyl isomerase [candidate division WWE3 bacterium]|uniref:Peptidyl-prolyl cis-trans isomerase n=1 Tax=candidate division WWE3 bacterium TaxID=2053526 RepID=A0A955LJU6_UNCKA|nr:peptidylprolyl isomerase [candidate division WWE3 bacterium]
MSPTPTPTPPIEMFLKQDQTYDAILHTTEGDIKIKLFQNEVPVAANNFAMLVRDGFYNGLTFHRVVEGFMIQGGDPNGDGTGDPGYSFADEAITRDYTRGTIAYANSGPNTNGSQFFIMHQDYGLAKNYVIFGEVTEGMDVVDKIATAETKYDDFGYEKSVPIDPVTITSAELVEE